MSIFVSWVAYRESQGETRQDTLDYIYRETGFRIEQKRFNMFLNLKRDVPKKYLELLHRDITNLMEYLLLKNLSVGELAQAIALPVRIDKAK